MDKTVNGVAARRDLDMVAGTDADGSQAGCRSERDVPGTSRLRVASGSPRASQRRPGAAGKLHSFPSSMDSPLSKTRSARRRSSSSRLTPSASSGSTTPAFNPLLTMSSASVFGSLRKTRLCNSMSGKDAARSRRRSPNARPPSLLQLRDSRTKRGVETRAGTAELALEQDARGWGRGGRTAVRSPRSCNRLCSRRPYPRLRTLRRQTAACTR